MFRNVSDLVFTQKYELDKESFYVPNRPNIVLEQFMGHELYFETYST